MPLHLNCPFDEQVEVVLLLLFVGAGVDVLFVPDLQLPFEQPFGQYVLLFHFPPLQTCDSFPLHCVCPLEHGGAALQLPFEQPYAQLVLFCQLPPTQTCDSLPLHCVAPLDPQEEVPKTIPIVFIFSEALLRGLKLIPDLETTTEAVKSETTKKPSAARLRGSMKPN